MANKKAALLVIDMQEHFKPIAQGIVGKVNESAEIVRRMGGPVIFTQHGHPPEDFEEPLPVLVKFWGRGRSIRFGSDAWHLLPDLDKQKDELVITSKQTYDAFQGTELLDVLRSQGIDTVVIAGVVTNLCSESTARSAMVKNFNVVFLSDANAAYDKPTHEATLLNMSSGFGTVLPCSKLESFLAGGES